VKNVYPGPAVALDGPVVGDGKKKRKEREGKRKKSTKSHASVIFHLFVGKPPVNEFSPNFARQEICRTLSSVQILAWKN